MSWLHLFRLRAPRPPLDPLESDRMQLAALSHESAAQNLVAILRSAVDHTAHAVEKPKKDDPKERPTWT